MHACEVHAYEIHAREIHAHEIPVHGMHAREVYAHEMPAREVHAYEMHAYKVYPHEMYTCEMHVHEMHDCEVYAHERHICKMYAHEIHAYEVYPYEMHAREIYAHRSVAFWGVWRCGCVYAGQRRRHRLASSNNEYLQPSQRIGCSRFSRSFHTYLRLFVVLAWCRISGKLRHGPYYPRYTALGCLSISAWEGGNSSRCPTL